MSRRLRVLDLCCCEGVGTTGYQVHAEVYGVDMVARFAKRYPGAGFHCGDALEVLRVLIAGAPVTFTRRDGSTIDLSLADFDFIHASPPCQGYTRGNAGKVTSWPKLIPDFRVLLDLTGLPYAIENVKDAGPEMIAPVTLCGCMFNLTAVDTDGIRVHLLRPRLFETNWPLLAPRPCDHTAQEWVAGVYGGARRDKYEARYVRKGGYVPKSKEVARTLLGVKHATTWNGLYECIPPAYTTHVISAWHAQCLVNA